MKRIIISSDTANEKKYKWTLGDKILLGWTAINLMLSFCLAIYSISGKWGNTTVGIVWLSMLGVYLLVFLFILIVSLNKNATVLRFRLKSSILGIKMINNISTLINLIMSLLVLIIARLRGDMSGAGAIISILVLFLFTLIGIMLNIKSFKKIKKKSQKIRQKAEKKNNRY